MSGRLPDLWADHSAFGGESAGASSVNGTSLDAGVTAVTVVAEDGVTQVGTVAAATGVVTVALTEVADAPTITWLNPASATVTKTNGVTGTVTFANDVWTIPINAVDTGGALLYGSAPDRWVFSLTDILGASIRPGTRWPVFRVVVDEVTRPADPDCEVTFCIGIADSSNTRKLIAGVKYDGNIGLAGLNAGAITVSAADAQIKHVEAVIPFLGGGRWGVAAIEGYNASGTTLEQDITRASGYEPTAGEDLKVVVEVGHRGSKPTRAADSTPQFRFGLYLEYTPTSASRIHS